MSTYKLCYLQRKLEIPHYYLINNTDFKIFQKHNLSKYLESAEALFRKTNIIYIGKLDNATLFSLFLVFLPGGKI